MLRKPIFRKISWWVSFFSVLVACFVWLTSYVAIIVLGLPTGSINHGSEEFEKYDGYSVICLDGSAFFNSLAFEEGFQFDVEFDSTMRDWDAEQRKAAFGDLEKSTFLLPLWIPVLALGILFAFLTRRSAARKELGTYLPSLLRKPIVRNFTWWGSLVFLIATGIAWIGSYAAALAVCLPSTGVPHSTHAFDFYDGHSIFCLDGEICIMPYTFSGSFKCDLTMDRDQRRDLKGLFFDDARRYATHGLVFNFERGIFVLFPLWMPLLAIGIPFAVITGQSIISNSSKTDGIAYRWMSNRRSKKICIPLAVVVFGLILVIFPNICGHFLTELYGPEFHHEIRRQFGLSETALLAIALSLCILSAYVIARVGYGLFRRKRIPISENGSPLCLTCRFNLKGNTSGICPECGTQIASGPVRCGEQDVTMSIPPSKNLNLRHFRLRSCLSVRQISRSAAEHKSIRHSVAPAALHRQDDLQPFIRHGPQRRVLEPAPVFLARYRISGPLALPSRVICEPQQCPPRTSSTPGAYAPRATCRSPSSPARAHESLRFRPSVQSAWQRGRCTPAATDQGRTRFRQRRDPVRLRQCRELAADRVVQLPDLIVQLHQREEAR
ncbi:MAG: hypothetical protein IPK83_01745 [Planctomycetes bacterium]|nr:hypothetical protein [Planctomycetota bacterium]